MTHQEIIELATKVYGENEWHESALFHLEAFAKLVAEKEREALLQNTIQAHEIGGFTDVVPCAAIRARGEQ